MNSSEVAAAAALGGKAPAELCPDLFWVLAEPVRLVLQAR